MTKLAEWVFGLGLFVTTWYLIFTRKIESSFTDSEILLAPVVFVAIIGVVLLSILIRRISTFNDCPEAAAELRKQIEQAREDLTSKGFKFD